MASVTKEFEVELDDSNVVNVSVTVEGDYESNYGADADGRGGTGMWFISDHSYEVIDGTDLSEEESAELAAKVSDLVDDEEWDFDSASEPDDEYEPDDFI